MSMFRTIQARIAITAGLSVTLLWLAAAAITVKIIGHELEEVFNDGLKATAERILPIASHDLGENYQRHPPRRHDNDEDDEHEDDDRGNEEAEREIRYGDNVTFIVWDSNGQVLLSSKDADQQIFPPYEKEGFTQTLTHQLYYQESLNDKLTIAVAEPLKQRTILFRKMLFSLVMPLVIVIPISLLAIIAGVRRSLRPIREFREGLKSRGAQNLSHLPDDGLPGELQPISSDVNQLLDRLGEAFAAERAFAANAAHELRTPVAGAIAQAQRIRAETGETSSSQRALEIETTLKRLMRMSEKLMQLARAEGGRLLGDEPNDLRPVLQMIVDDFTRAGEERIVLKQPDKPVLSKLDPDAFGILSRNLIENALKHGAKESPVQVELQETGIFSVANDGTPLPAETMNKLLQRFVRGNGKIAGNGLGLAIVKAIAERSDAELKVISPRSGKNDGVEVRLRFP